MQIFFHGIATGLFLQLAIGPLFFLILNITLSSNFMNALLAIVGVTLADYLCIALSLAGINKVEIKKDGNKVIGVISSVVLVLFGCLILYKSFFLMQPTVMKDSFSWTPFACFSSGFFITISSPLTLVFWSGIFTAKAIEKGYLKHELIYFGLGAGSATFIFISSIMLLLSYLKFGIPDIVVQILNGLVGILLIGYGSMRGRNILKEA